ncbi:MAG TPA: hypothetical protein VLV15_07230, partial [Dongiaceae bacterium]|nr:hypothetical protein [Dongiaceae bacterium]
FLGSGLDAFPAAWIPQLLAPTQDDTADFVSPHYVRAPHEGAITRSIVYPMFRAMYGWRVRQPASGEFAASARLQTHLLDQGFWDAEHAESGIDLWIASASATGGFRLAEAEFGPRPPGLRTVVPDLSDTIAQVVGALFADLEVHDAMWQRVRGSTAVPATGTPPATPLADPDLDPARLIDAFRLGYDGLRDVWAWIVPPRTMLYFKRLAAAGPETFRVEDDVWAGAIYDFAVAYRGRTMPRDHLLRALTPLYLGWLASFLLEMHGHSAADADGRIERLCATFEARKPYLVSRWRWPDRFRV